MFSPAIDELLTALRCLPGVGPKTAQRMALHLLEKDATGADRLAHAITQARAVVVNCPVCRNLTESEPCRICANPSRDDTQLCVVESPMDVFAVEQSGSYRGRYFVLRGHLSPMDGVGPDDIGVPALIARVTGSAISEVILATNPTVEGEATAHYLAERLRQSGVAVTRLAQGVPSGGELEYLDGVTVSQAFRSRRQVEG
ncbi:MAG TPA: recombination mediator RecR [Pseudomonadales bacterium]|jgi:recombination protein RecR